MNDRAWLEWAIAQVEADANRSADTHLHTFPLPAEWGINLYLKDESVHPTGSLKHRLARSLFLYGICNGRIRHDTPIVEASSGSTAPPWRWLAISAFHTRFPDRPWSRTDPSRSTSS